MQMKIKSYCSAAVVAGDIVGVTSWEFRVAHSLTWDGSIYRPPASTL
jgi:hypothetical protein